LPPARPGRAQSAGAPSSPVPAHRVPPVYRPPRGRVRVILVEWVPLSNLPSLARLSGVAARQRCLALRRRRYRCPRSAPRPMPPRPALPACPAPRAPASCLPPAPWPAPSASAWA
jgi:hypothetical protein